MYRVIYVAIMDPETQEVDADFTYLTGCSDPWRHGFRDKLVKKLWETGFIDDIEWKKKKRAIIDKQEEISDRDAIATE